MERKDAKTTIGVNDHHESYPLVYNMWIESMTINANTVVLQTGKPEEDTPPPDQ